MNIIIDPTPEQWNVLDTLQQLSTPHLSIPEDGSDGTITAMLAVDTDIYSFDITPEGNVTGEVLSEEGDGWVPVSMHSLVS